ncbi:hypothetical protein GS507_18445 [Rhodococcus hoagii]|nr:hypothetical protein [Prescottella equi]
MSWLDLEAFLTHLPNRSAFKRKLDPWAEYLDPPAELEVSMLIADKLDQLRWVIGNSGVPQEQQTPFPVSMRERMRAAKAKADAPQEAEPTEVVDIRTKIHRRRAGLAPDRPKRPTNPKAQAVRDRLAQARAAANQ